MTFKIEYFNRIKNVIFQLHLKANISITFKSKYLNEIIFDLYHTALYLAVEKENLEIIKLLLTNDNIDINILNIFINILIIFIIKYFNYI